MNQETEERLKQFIEEHFDFGGLVEIGLFTKDMKGNYQAQADKICHFFGYKSVFEYGAHTISCHISYPKGNRPLYVNNQGEIHEEPFVTVLKGWLDN